MQVVKRYIWPKWVHAKNIYTYIFLITIDRLVELALSVRPNLFATPTSDNYVAQGNDLLKMFLYTKVW